MAAWRKLSCKLLGHETIRAETVDLGDLDRELAEIDENLIRNELTALERGEHLARRKAIYELLHPETKQGGDRKSEDAKSKPQDAVLIEPFTQDTAKKVGKFPTWTKRLGPMASSIPPSARQSW